MLSLFSNSNDKQDSAIDLPISNLKSAENELPPQLFIPADPLPVPPGLDAAFTNHLHRIIKQCLDEVCVEYEPWEKVIARLALEIVNGVPSALNIVGKCGVDGEIPPKLLKEQRRIVVAPVPVHHTIYVETISAGTPTDSRFVRGSLNEESIKHGILIAVPHLRDVGGTVRLRGEAKDLSKIAEIMKFIIYVAVHMKLELCLLQDHGVSPLASPTPEPEQVDFPPSRSARVGASLSAVASKLIKKDNGHNRTAIVWSIFTKGSSNGDSKSNSRTRTPQSKVNSFEDQNGEQIGTPNRFERTIQEIEQTILSISPDVHFPPPHLLVRLRDEEAAFYDSAHRPKSYAESDVESSIEPPGIFRKRFRNWGNRSHSNGDSNRKSAGIKINAQDVERLSMTSGQSTVSVRSIGSDVTAGLSYLTTNNNSLSGVIQHQSLAYLHSIYKSPSSSIPCQTPEIRLCEYYKKEGPTLDLTIGQQIDKWTCHSYDPCSDPTCRLLLWEHVFRYSHGNKVISITMSEANATISTEEQEQIYAWSKCRTCNWMSKPIPISTATWKYSFTKYLELLIYHPSFKPRMTCEHIERDCDAIQRSFRQGWVNITITTETINLYEMRVPKIQLVHSHLGRSPQASDHTLNPAEAAEIVDKLSTDISYFYGSVHDVIKALESSTAAAAVKAGHGTPAQIRHQVTLDEMGRHFRDEDQGLMEQLKRVAPSSANNVRRRFCKITAATIKRLDEWRIRHAPNADLPKYLLPEYITTKGVYLFPNSYIVARLEEPSSIIAFTLNSKEYLREVAIGRAAGAFGLGASSNGVLWENTQGDCRFKLKGFSHDTTPDAPRIHVKYKFSDAQESFSCTVYYAFQFEELRRQCGFDIGFVRSLVRCTPWKADGGKSRVGFFKTMDDQLIIKQLVTDWTHLEKDALLQFAPSYFDYMSNLNKNPTILAKIFGFYTLKYKNEATGVVTRMDVLVMENVFCNVNVSRTFDLKGVPERIAPAKECNKKGRTMFDQDWIDGRYQSLLMIHSHSKRLIMQSVKNDTAFLASNNIMDYSMIVGVNDERRELVVGIVDFIGRYTAFKALENQTKTALKGANLRHIGRAGLAREDSASLVTVLPPAQYKDRFVRAMEQYFVTIPDKWSKMEVAGSGKTNASNTASTIDTILPQRNTNFQLPPVI